MSLLEFAISPPVLAESCVAHPERLVSGVEQHPLHFPHVLPGQAPVVGTHHAKIDQREGGDASGQVDVFVEVTGGERPRRREDGLPSVQPRIPRPRDGAPETSSIVDRRSSIVWSDRRWTMDDGRWTTLVHEDHVVELVDRFEADDERRIPVLFKHGCRKQRRLEAMRRPMTDDPAEAAQRRAAGWRLRVVGKRVEVALDGQRRPQPGDEPTLGRCQRQSRRSSSATRSVAVQSAPA